MDQQISAVVRRAKAAHRKLERLAQQQEALRVERLTAVNELVAMGFSQHDIAKLLQISQPRVSQIRRAG